MARKNTSVPPLKRRLYSPCTIFGTFVLFYIVHAQTCCMVSLVRGTITTLDTLTHKPLYRYRTVATPGTVSSAQLKNAASSSAWLSTFNQGPLTCTRHRTITCRQNTHIRMLKLVLSLLLSTTAQAVAQSTGPSQPPPMSQPNTQYPVYTPTNFVRLMVVAQYNYVTNAPFLTAVVTTQGDDLVVASIPNGDPPTAFNVTEKGFRAQNGKFLHFDKVQGRLHLDSDPHNETQYMDDGSIYSTDVPGEYVGLNLCPQARNIFTLRFGVPCTDYYVQLFPIPPQHLTGLWENHTQYPSPRQRGWMNWDAENITLGDNTTLAPMLSIQTIGASHKLEVAWTWVLLAFTMFFF